MTAAAVAVVLGACLGLGKMQAAEAAVAPPHRQAVPVTAWHGGSMAGVQWMIKANDYAELPAMYGHWSWMMCRQTVHYGEEYGRGFPPETGQCRPGQVKTYADYWSLRSAILGDRDPWR